MRTERTLPQRHKGTLQKDYARWAATYGQERHGLIEAKEPHLAADSGSVKVALDVAKGDRALGAALGTAAHLCVWNAYPRLEV